MHSARITALATIAAAATATAGTATIVAEAQAKGPAPRVAVAPVTGLAGGTVTGTLQTVQGLQLAELVNGLAVPSLVEGVTHLTSDVLANVLTLVDGVRLNAIIDSLDVPSILGAVTHLTDDVLGEVLLTVDGLKLDQIIAGVGLPRILAAVTTLVGDEVPALLNSVLGLVGGVTDSLGILDDVTAALNELLPQVTGTVDGLVGSLVPQVDGSLQALGLGSLLSGTGVVAASKQQRGAAKVSRAKVSKRGLLGTLVACPGKSACTVKISVSLLGKRAAKAKTVKVAAGEIVRVKLRLLPGVLDQLLDNDGTLLVVGKTAGVAKRTVTTAGI